MEYLTKFKVHSTLMFILLYVSSREQKKGFLFCIIVSGMDFFVFFNVVRHPKVVMA